MRLGTLLAVLLIGLQAQAASPFTGFYNGFVYSSISGTITVPESPIGYAVFTVDENGNISGNMTGSVDGSGNITWNANGTGFTTGSISDGVLAATTSQNNSGAITTFRIAADNNAGGFSGGVAAGLLWYRPSPSGALMRGVTYGGNQYVAVGPGGSVAISGNGTNWVAVSSGISQQLNAVAYGNNTYVAVGDAKTVVTSPDGITWIPRSLNADIVAQNVLGVAFGNGKFVALNLIKEVYTSTDGISWTKIASPPTTQYWNNLKYAGGRFVLVGQNSSSGAIATSADGITWSATKTLASTGGILDVTYGNGKWVGVNISSYFTFTAADASDATNGTTGSVSLGGAVGFVNGVFVSNGRYFSTDGITWQRYSYPNIDINDMVTANGLMVAVGGAMTTTTDGKNWGVQSKVLPLATINNVGVNGAISGNITYDEIQYYNSQGAWRYLRLGVGGIQDERINKNFGTLYTKIPSPTADTLRDGVGYSSSTAVAVGDNGAIVRYGAGVGEWTNAVSGTSVNLVSVAAKDGNNLIAVGAGGTIVRTTNGGQTWAGVSSGAAHNLNRVEYFVGTGFNYYIAVGDNGVILKSADGSSWSVLPSGTTKRLVGTGQRTIGNVKLLTLAEDSTVLASEDHGATWYAITVNAPFPMTFMNSNGTTAYGVGGFQMTASNGTNWTYALPAVSNIRAAAQGNGKFVLASDNALLTSADLENWSAAPLFHSGVGFGNGVFVAVGGTSTVTNNSIVSTSVDGVNWIERVTPATLYSLKAVAFGQGKFVVVGAGGTILSSTDGANWVDRTIGGPQELRSVTYGNGKFVAVGVSGAVRYSTDGDNWTATTAPGNLNSVSYGNGLFAAVGESRTIITSTNGSTWSGSKATTPATTASRVFRSISYVGDRFIVVGDKDDTGSVAMVINSTDGNIWTRELANIQAVLYGSTRGNGTYVAVGAGGTIARMAYEDAASPNITGQPEPASQTVAAGANVTYAAAVAGTNLQYRWIKNGTPMTDGPGVSGATSASLILTGVDVLDAGIYQLSVFNNAGSALSVSMTLNVNGPPVITVQPLSASIGVTLNTNFTVTAVGPGTLTYQWRKDAQSISDGGHYNGATTSRLNIITASGADEGGYDVIVSNSFGSSAPSNTATLTVNRPPTITTPPVTLSINQGQTLNLSVVADGTPTLTYVWKRNGATVNDGGRISGTTTANLVINNAVVADAGSYTVTVANAFNPAATSASVYVSVLGPGALRADFTFNGSAQVYDIAPTADGKFIIAGDFSITSGNTWFKLAKIDSNGVPVSTFATTNSASIANSTIRTVAVQPDGQLLVGGSFWQWGGNSQYYYAARLDADGVLDANYKPGVTLTVKKIIPVANNKTLIARTGLGFSTSYVDRFNSDGTLDSTFTEIVNANRELHGMAVQSDGTIWVSGVFGLKKAAANGTSPTAVTTYAPFAEMVYVHVGPDDKIYYSDNNGQYFGRLNADGSRDTSFVITINGHVADMAFLANGNMVIVGDFQTVNSTTCPHIAVIDSTGALVNGFNSPYTWSFGNALNSIEMLGDGSALVGGNINLTLPISQRYLQRIQIGESVEAGITYSQWLADKGLSPGVNDGAGQDADNDGLQNIAEFAFGSHPGQANSNNRPLAFTANDGGTLYPAVRYIHNKLATGITVVLTAATDVRFVNSVATTALPPVDLGGDLEQVTIRGSTPFSSTSTIFFHLQVSQP